MDLILGRFWDRFGADLDDATLDAYEALLDESDQDLYRWMSGQNAPPQVHAPLVARIQGKIEPL